MQPVLNLKEEADLTFRVADRSELISPRDSGWISNLYVKRTAPAFRQLFCLVHRILVNDVPLQETVCVVGVYSSWG